MKVLIIYSSKNGCAEECARLLEKEICDNFDIDVINIAERTPGIKEYDFVVIGGGVHFSKFYPPLRKFIKENEEALVNIPHGLFLCCGLMENAEEYIKTLFPPRLIESAVCTEYFGGQLKVDKHHGIWKLIIRMVRNHFTDREEPLQLPDIIESNISLFASKLIIYRKESNA